MKLPNWISKAGPVAAFKDTPNNPATSLPAARSLHPRLRRPSPSGGNLPVVLRQLAGYPLGNFSELSG